jgi:hypothetical protein
MSLSYKEPKTTLRIPIFKSKRVRRSPESLDCAGAAEIYYSRVKVQMVITVQKQTLVKSVVHCSPNLPKKRLSKHPNLNNRTVLIIGKPTKQLIEDSDIEELHSDDKKEADDTNDDSHKD